jgi:dTDP-4-dehydrorhamnose reductase
LKILVTGSEGMLGQAVMDRLGSAHDLMGVDLADADLTNTRDVESLFQRIKPEWVIHCAAWTDVDGAESSQETAMAVNGLATEHVARSCDLLGAGLTYISTDYVFNGSSGAEGYQENHARDPINYYGLTKARGEEAVERMNGPWQIVRTSWLFGDGQANFPKTIRRLLAEKPHLKVVADQRGCPTHAGDLADVLGFLVSSGSRGIFHGTNSGQCTWFDLAREVAVLVNADPSMVSACSSSEFPTPASRPSCSVLLSRRLEEIGCPERPLWQDAVKRYIRLLESGLAVHP